MLTWCMTSRSSQQTARWACIGWSVAWHPSAKEHVKVGGETIRLLGTPVHRVVEDRSAGGCAVTGLLARTGSGLQRGRQTPCHEAAGGHAVIVLVLEWVADYRGGCRC